MKTRKIFVILIFLQGYLFAQTDANNSCINCHSQLEDELLAPTKYLQTDIHLKNGITCEKCHGGNADVQYEDDAEAAMNPRMGYIGAPAKKDIPKLCSKCHSNPAYIRKFNPKMPTDQYQRYLTSKHGQLLQQGDEKVAVCTDCHRNHNIQPANMTTSPIYPTNIPETCGKCHADADYMKPYGIPTNQVEKYKNSIHGIALFEKGDRSAPVCNDCHGNHGAVPPGVASISHVCGTCHLSQMEMFEQSPHKKAYAEMGLPQCEACHGNHDVIATNPNMLGIAEGAFCIECHDEDSKGYKTAKLIKQKEDSLISAIEMADSLLGRAEKAGVEVTDAKIILKQAEDALIKARNSVHYFSVEKFDEIAEPGYKTARKAVVAGFDALKEVQNRRRALAVFSLIIFVVAISLFFKIKTTGIKE